MVSSRFLYLTSILVHFWKRWSREYLTDFRESHRYKKAIPQKITIGGIVLIHEGSRKRRLWKIERIEKLISGKDGVVKGAVVRKAGSKAETLSRPIIKLFPLEIVKQLGSMHELFGFTQIINDAT